MTTPTTNPPPTIRVAVTQSEPIWLDLNATITKTCSLIAEAASQGAQLISFPECWIPGYPAWIWTRPVSPILHTLYMRNSLSTSSPQFARILNAAKAHNITVVLGFSENVHDSLYISQAIISHEGEVLSKRRKIKATHMERTVFGDADAETGLAGVVETAVGRVGALSCWEHVQPLLKYYMCAQREAIHVAAWPPLFKEEDEGDEGGLFSMSGEGAAVLARTYAIESSSFVLHTTAVISQAGIDLMQTATGAIMNTPGGGSSAVFGPDGRLLSEALPPTEEGIIYADLDFEQVYRAKAFVDIVGHYSRPDLLWLGVGGRDQRHVREVGDEA
ncbi:hypothetical protein AtubIFM54640_001852 [Aspergillus tubingensis]|nr:hypothetical protein AtubIFM54640_001852 [Aspergillus tubingensis]